MVPNLRFALLKHLFNTIYWLSLSVFSQFANNVFLQAYHLFYILFNYVMLITYLVHILISLSCVIYIHTYVWSMFVIKFVT